MAVGLIIAGKEEGPKRPETQVILVQASLFTFFLLRQSAALSSATEH